ncbi:hypothetical protein [Shimia sp. MMG029]|uniref:hypothetical protein n=1 Tax=Shimia sp. MMG029 TaxID=3021978 RepID=UPI0022FEE0E7|nr:hypothetical protein [Shimia sp. MMG029]MDA5558135.1 hypothetical protein [Shimia sp. MMG029]
MPIYTTQTLPIHGPISQKTGTKELQITLIFSAQNDSFKDDSLKHTKMRRKELAHASGAPKISKNSVITKQRLLANPGGGKSIHKGNQLINSRIIP